MNVYKIEFLINELKKNNINNMLINKINDDYYNIIMIYNNNYIVIENKDSACNYNKEEEKKELLQIYHTIRDNDNKGSKRSYDDMMNDINNIDNAIDVNNIYIIRINFNGYMTKKKKRYPNIFTINEEKNININYTEWNWRFNLLKTLINDITNNIDTNNNNNNEKKNYYIKLFFRHFSMGDLYNYNVI